MWARCTCENNRDFHNYGGRGITVCETWSSFTKFIEDMGPKPDSRFTLERRDNDKGYSKDNCKWATRAEQNLNKREYKRSKSTLSGVRARYNGKYSSQISIGGKKVHLGTFNTEQEAHERFIQERSKRVYIPEKTPKRTTKDTE